MSSPDEFLFTLILGSVFCDYVVFYGVCYLVLQSLTTSVDSLQQPPDNIPREFGMNNGMDHMSCATSRNCAMHSSV